MLHFVNFDRWNYLHQRQNCLYFEICLWLDWCTLQIDVMSTNTTYCYSIRMHLEMGSQKNPKNPYLAFNLKDKIGVSVNSSIRFVRWNEAFVAFSSLLQEHWWSDDDNIGFVASQGSTSLMSFQNWSVVNRLNDTMCILSMIFFKHILNSPRKWLFTFEGFLSKSLVKIAYGWIVHLIGPYQFFLCWVWFRPWYFRYSISRFVYLYVAWSLHWNSFLP